MASPVRYTGSSPSRTGFSPRVVGRLLARLEKISKAQKESGERGNDPNDEEARDGHDVKNGGRSSQAGDGHGRDRVSNHGYRYVHWTDNNAFPVNGNSGDSFYRKTWPNDSHPAEHFSDEASIQKTSQKDSFLAGPVWLRRKEEPNGHPSTTALRGLSLVEGNHPGYTEEDAYICPAASDLEVDEDYWVKYNDPAIRGALQMPKKKLPDSKSMLGSLPRTPALVPRRQSRGKMEESGYLVRGQPVCSSNSPGHYRFVPISSFGNAEGTGKAEKKGSAELGVKVNEDGKAWGNTQARDNINVQDNTKVRGGVEAQGNVKARSDCKAHGRVQAEDYVTVSLKSNNNAKVEKPSTPQSSISPANGTASHGVDDGFDQYDTDKEWDFVSTWHEAEEAEAFLKVPTIRGFPPSLLP